MKTIFDIIDKNGDGLINKQDLIKGLDKVKMSKGNAKSEAERIFKKLEQHDTGLLDFDEWC